ncbi:MAG: hypothetical protein K6G83_15335 [Lachnospiraceae bacterium]|nr:hypothetical protein [Lachnospiraceae bacterium]
MQHITEILGTILPVVLMLLIGVLARRTSLLSREGIGALKSVVVNITLPAVMLNAFATMTYSAKNIIITLMMFLVCLAAWFLGRFFSKGSRFIPFLTTGFEAGMLGYSLFMLLYGSERISEFAAIDLGQVLFVFTLYKIFLGLDGNEKPKASQLISEMIHSPTIIAILIGVLLGATGLYRLMEPGGLSGLLDACTDFVSAPTGAVILLTIGYDLSFEHIPWKLVLKTLAARVLIMLALRLAAGGIVSAIGMGAELNGALNIMFILPPPYVLPVFADDESQRNFVSSALSMMTVVTIFCFIILTAVLR